MAIRFVSVVSALVVLCLTFLGTPVVGDVPASCMYNQTLGQWKISMSNTTTPLEEIDPQFCLACQNYGVKATDSFVVTLIEPSLARDEDGNEGFWTLVYNQGFELVIQGKKFFAYFDWDESGTKVISHCDRTKGGCFHDKVTSPGEMPKNWGCYMATKLDKKSGVNVLEKNTIDHDHTIKSDPELVENINSKQSLWTATDSAFVGMKIGEVIGTTGQKSRPIVPSLQKQQCDANLNLPDSFDYRDYEGVDYTTMRDQLNCGSCYAFGATEMLSQRSRLINKDIKVPQFSVQDPVSCSTYSQGCSGGFPYLVSKFGEDFGMVLEECFGYFSGIMKEVPCEWKCTNTSLRRSATDYHYVGGFYGGCNEQAMMKELVEDGPLAVSFEVYPDFMHYHSGIYNHTDEESTVNPFVLTNHCVLLVGYGIENGTKYWIVQNSWGRHFGEGGFFRILRGTDHCGIESLAVGAMPVDSFNRPEKYVMEKWEIGFWVAVAVAGLSTIALIVMAVTRQKQRRSQDGYRDRLINGQ